MGANVSQIDENHCNLVGNGEQRDKIINQLIQRYDHLNYKQLREYLDLLPSPMNFSHLEATFKIDFNEYPNLKNRLKRCFDPLSPITYLEKTVHLVYGSPNDRCRLLFHLFCHKCHQIRNYSNEEEKAKCLQHPQYYMNFSEFQAAIDMLVKGRIEWVDHNDRFYWLFQIADEYKEERIELSHFARVIVEHPHLSEYLNEMCVPLWKRELRKSKLFKKDSFSNLFEAALENQKIYQTEAQTHEKKLRYLYHRSPSKSKFRKRTNSKSSSSSTESDTNSSRTGKLINLLKSKRNINQTISINQNKPKFNNKSLGRNLSENSTIKTVIRDSMTQNEVKLKRVSYHPFEMLGNEKNGLSIN